MKADAIIFDKDGTLLDFDAFWVSLSVKALEDVLGELGTEQDLLGEILEEGTSRMAPRPHHEKILKHAEPKIVRIYSAPYD